MTKKIIIGVAILIIIAGGAYFIMHKDETKTPSTSSSSSATPANTQTQTTPQPTTNQVSSATITYSNNGFSPALTTVKSGDIVAITNTSSNDLQFDSDPHPEHTDDTDLNVGIVAPGQTKTFTVAKQGTFKFHNHLNSSDTASITVQ